jgi:hypothetical protein
VEERMKAPALVEAVTPPTPVAPKSVAQRQAELRAQRAAASQAAAAAATAAPAVTPIAPVAADPTATPPAARVTVLNAPPASPIATGSIQAPPAQGVPAPPSAASIIQAAAGAFGPGSIKPAPAAPSGVELSSGPSLDALRLNWSLLSERHAPLKSLEARYTGAGEGQPYQLLAGPLATPEEAARVCAQLKAKKVSCRVTGYGGNAL